MRTSFFIKGPAKDCELIGDSPQRKVHQQYWSVSELAEEAHFIRDDQNARAHHLC